MRRIALLDRDGTINVERGYLTVPDQVELIPGAAEGIRLLRSLGLAAVVVTNQSAIGRGKLTHEELDTIHQQLQSLLAAQGVSLDGIYVCAHRPEDHCACRKPSPGLAQRAAQDFGADLAESFVIGDKACDIDLGRRLGARTILVRTGYGSEVARDGSVHADWVANDLLAAARLIQAEASRKQGWHG